MTRTPEELAESLGSDSSLYANGVDPALERGDAYLALSNAYMAFECTAIRAMIMCRSMLGDPRAPLGDAVKLVAKTVQGTLASDAGATLWRLVDLTYIAYFGHLLGDEGATDVLEHACAFEDWKKSSRMYANQALNVALLNAMRGADRPRDWQRAIEALQSRRRDSLFAETYGNYMRLVLAARDGHVVEARAAASCADELYLKRSRDRMYAAARLEGGGPDNALVVDFRSAAIIRVLMPSLEPELLAGGSPHVWRW